MPSERSRRILLIAGDYDVIQRVREVLPATRFGLENAFNHRDALYLLQHTRYDAIVVDGAMVDRHGGQWTLQAVATLEHPEPVVVLVTPQTPEDDLRALDVPSISDLNPSTIRDAIDDWLDTAVDTHSLDETPIRPRNTEEINTFFALSRSLTEVLDSSEVLNRIVEAARRLTNAEEGMLLLPEGEELYLRARVGIDEESARNFRVKTQDTLAGQVFHSGEAVLVGASGPQKVKTEYFVNSLLYVPIASKGEIIGVLGVDNRDKEDQFTVHDQRLLVNLAAFAAIALENAQVHRESLERSRELETMVAASEILNDSLALPDTLIHTCEQLVSVLNAGYAEILRWDQPQGRLSTQACLYRQLWRFGQGPELDVADHPILQTAFETGNPQWLRLENGPMVPESIRSLPCVAQALLVLPIGANEQRLGCIRFFYATAPEHELPGEVLHRTWRLGLEGLADALNRLDRQLPPSILEPIAELVELVSADWCDLLLATDDPDTLAVLLRLGRKVWLEPTMRLELTAYPDLADTLHTLALIHRQAGDGPLPPGARSFLDRTQAQVMLGIPLARRGQAQGLAVVAATGRNRTFSAREIDMARAIVGQAATALENATLLHDLERSLRDLRNAQDRLVQAARLSAMGELAAVVAHQINNPLTTIIADTELMLLDERSDSPRIPSLKAIERAGKRAANVARRLLMIARPFDPAAPPVDVDVGDSIRGVLSLLQMHLERKDIRVQTAFPSDPLPPVMAIKGQLDDVWVNLLLNAYDALAGRENGEIGIDVRHRSGDKRIDVVIWDNGPGIPPDIRAQIFDPFFTTKPAGEGTGLGLHICRETVENIGGSIRLDPASGPATRFVVTLPTADA